MPSTPAPDGHDLPYAELANWSQEQVLEFAHRVLAKLHREEAPLINRVAVAALIACRARADIIANVDEVAELAHCTIGEAEIAIGAMRELTEAELDPTKGYTP